MVCTQCGAEMDQTDKNTFTGREIRDYECPSCGHTDWEDCGVALWQVMHDAREEDEAQAALSTPASSAARPTPNPPRSFWQRVAGLFRKSN